MIILTEFMTGYKQQNVNVSTNFQKPNLPSVSLKSKGWIEPPDTPLYAHKCLPHW